MANQTLTNNPSLSDERIDALEARNAFQDDVIEQLNKELAIHQAQIAQLKEQLHLLAGRMRDMKGSTIASIDEETPPPHY